MQNTIKFALNGTVNQERRYSPAIWDDCPLGAIRSGAVDGVIFEDDFTDFVVAATQTTAVTQGRYTAYCATAGTWHSDNMPTSATTPVAGDGASISGLCDTDGDAMAIGTYACPFILTTTMSGKLWFEARVAMTSILTNMGQLFCGLCENRTAAFSATVPLGNADTANASCAMIGFRRAEDGLGVLDTIMADHSATETVVQASANTTLAANTWIKLGMKFDPRGDPLRCVRFYVDNVECSTAITRAVLLATTFVDVSNLGPCLAFYADSAGTANYVYLNRWRCVQTFE